MIRWRLVFTRVRQQVDLERNLLQNIEIQWSSEKLSSHSHTRVKENKKEPHGYLCLYPNAKHSINISNYIVCATALLRVLVSLGWPWFNQDKITYGHLLCSFSSSFVASHSFRLVLSCLNYPLHALFCLFPWKLQETKTQA